MIRQYRILREEKRWTAVICYNQYRCVEFYFDRVKYSAEDVLRKLRIHRILDADSTEMSDIMWEKVRAAREAFLAEKQKQGSDMSFWEVE